MEVFAKLPGPLQQSMAQLLQKIMKDPLLPALATLPAAWVLCYVPHFTKLALILTKQAPQEYNNITPRTTDLDAFGDKAAIIKRCKACHENALESFPAFAAAVLLCKAQKAKAGQVVSLSVRYLGLRVLFTIFYILGRSDAVAAMRTLSWAGGKLTIWRLFMAAL
mmetsp:Transcript_54932/g.148248  ORF Transcript_54932/g.148248 Transcript_54932/m.148248 type:complete len:165 (-) Transcript_54932:139-633(-)